MEVHIIFILYNRSIEQLAHKIGGNGAIGSHKALELGEERAGRRRGAPEGREGATCSAPRPAPGLWSDGRARLLGLMHWAGAGWRDCPSLRGEAAYQHRSPLAGLSRTIGGPRRTGTGWLRCKEITPLPARTPTPGTLSCRPGSSAPTTHQLGAHLPATEDLWSHPPQKTAGPADQGGGRGPLVAR